MSRQDNPQPSEAFIVPADLGPADARAVREALLAHLAAAGPESALELGDEAPTPSPCALQLLVAALRAERSAPRLGRRAAAALSSLNRMEPVPA